ncbi:MAG TPA: GAF domain-containing protein, partial [Blastocatellia bacterium]|nr:GAF domain-containing protein [Blastocatellia bacterium]
MQYDQIRQYIQDPKWIAAGSVFVLLLIVLAVWFIKSRGRSGGKEQRMQELLEREHEAQLVAAADHLPFSTSSIEVARAIATIFFQYLSIRVVAVYSVRDGDQQLTNIFTAEGVARQGDSFARLLPVEILDSYRRPQLAPSAVFLDPGPSAAPVQSVGSPQVPRTPQAARDAGYNSDDQATVRLDSRGTPAAPAAAAAVSNPAAPGTEPKNLSAGQATGFVGASPRPGPESYVTGNLNSPLQAGAAAVTVLPWRGPFAWRGLIVGAAQEPVELESVVRAYDSIGQLGSRLAAALELERKDSESEESVKQSARFTTFIESLLSSFEEGAALPGVLQGVAELLAANSAAYWRVEPQTRTVRMVAAHGLNASEFLPVPFGQGFCGRVAESGESVTVKDAPSDPRCLFPNEARDSGIGSYLGVPIVSKAVVIGVLEVHTPQPREWNMNSVFTLQAAAVALEGVLTGGLARDKLAGEQWLKAESAYMGLSEALHGLHSRDEVLEASVELLGHSLGASRVVAIELDERMASRAYGVKYEYRDPNYPTATNLAFSEEFAARVFTEAKSESQIVLNNSEEHSMLNPAMVSRLNVLSEMAIPVKLSGEVRALLYIHQCDHRRQWTRDEIEFGGQVGRQVALAMGNLRALQKVQKEVEVARAEANRSSEVGARARGLIDALPETVIGLDREGRLTFFNAPGRQRLKLRNEDLGRMADMTEALTLADESIWDKVNSCEALAHFESQITAPRTAAPLAAPDRPAEASSRAQGAMVPVSIAVSPIHNEGGEITGRLVVLTDLSHLGAQGGREGSQAPGIVDQRIAQLERQLAEANRV